MEPPDPHYLFSERELRSVLNAKKHDLLSDIDGLAEDYVLRTDREKLCQYFCEKYSVEAPTLCEELPEIFDRRKVSLSAGAYSRIPTRTSISAIEIDFGLRVQGDPVFFECAPSSRSSILPHGEVRNGELVFSLVSLSETAEQLRAESDRNIATIRQFLGWIAADLGRFSKELQTIAQERIDSRRQRIERDQTLVDAVGYPIRRWTDEEAFYAVPMTIRKLQPRLPQATTTSPREPFLESKDYDDILSTLHHMATVMERSPNAFAGLNEEAIRRLFLIPLNGLYEGEATGQTFNFSGKPDILIRVNDRNIFVAECAIWRGPAYLAQKIDQLLGYATWRDCKLALLIFNKDRELTKVLSSIRGGLRQHPKFRRELSHRSETEFRFILAHRDDPERELTLTVCTFEVPA